MDTPQSRLPTEARRAEIVAAVLHLAATQSPAHITTGDIAGELGFTQGAVFRHFPSKDAIWLAVLAWVDAELIAALERAAQEGRTPLDGLERVFMAHIRFVMAWPGVPRILFHDLQRPDDTPLKQRVRQLLGRYRQILARLFDAAARQGQVGGGLDTHAAATLFIGTIQGLVMQSMLAASPSGVEDEARRVLVLYLRAIQEPS
ncbi:MULTISPECIES: TetR/AcrR family transcriptional regulator [Zoogloea]|uniref:TetR/AcrR family transcriptional regulator n=1 Tax=Zoogloea oleivorans TaxID=1552750 RepID=A0A6C2CR56_9RHOO|nr:MULTISPECIES: TetR/AcrR family transcriptional regulator [Zoogloea]MDD2667009.1 TetR/AcrR family transcriptional regulator [Zoogloea sp.]TYC56186.1 TetR/AcrR family transcriptional regulator [Zoogloea oleivorans]